MEFGIKMALGIMLALNFVFFLSQVSVDNMSNNEGIKFFNYDDSLISQYDSGNYSLTEFNPNDLPETQTGVTSDGGFFSDIFGTIKNWLLDIPGVKYVIGFINSVPNFLKMVGLPPIISFAIGFLWHAMGVILLVIWLKG